MKMLQSLLNDISLLKSKLYLTLDSNENLNNSDVYQLSVKLDRLICEYISYAQRS
jgi:hypothetical protein